MRTRARAKLVLLISATIAIPLSGCGTSSTTTPTTTEISTTSQPTSTTETTLPAESMALAQYWVGETSRGFRLYREFAHIEITPDPITAALRSLVSSQPKDSDYTTLWPAGTQINSVIIIGDTAIVDLTFGKLNVGAEGEQLAIAQLVWTATAANPATPKVFFLVDGKKVDSLAGHVDTSNSFTRAPAYEVVAPVWITSPEGGAQVSAQGFTLSGLASTFEANVAWSVSRNGKIVRQGATTAGGAAPAWTPWSVAIGGLAPGEYQFAAMEYSAMDGSLVAQDTKTVTLK
ncbi:MAG: Gmad2 immunoglobulin-like domain-containing protein [Ilumatobacteraceae bacterium]